MNQAAVTLVMLLVMDSGLRLGELASLRWPAIKDDHLVVRGKVGDRVVPVSRVVREQLEGHGDGYYVWIGKRGPMSRSGIQTAFKRMFMRSGIGTRKAGPHTLRHTFGTWYISAGGNVFALQEIMGHTRIAATQPYVTLALT